MPLFHRLGQGSSTFPLVSYLFLEEGELKREVEKMVVRALEKLGLKAKVQVDYPRDPRFGDYTTNAAMVMARKATMVLPQPTSPWRRRFMA